MPDERPGLERVWTGTGPGARAARLALAPLAAAYRAVTAARNALYDRGTLRQFAPPIPALSVGNLSVGGTGKTPVAAWIAGRLREAGASPAIVMRGYGNDEPLVHAQLNPGLRVIADPDRVEGARRAAVEGADCVVLDDAFQHRRVRRVADIVLVSADEWTGRQRLLPAGPWREGLGALRRADVVLVTRKAAEASRAQVLAARLHDASHVPVAVAHLSLGDLAGSDGTRPLAELGGQRVLAVAAVGNPGAFAAQLRTAGATVRPAFFADHHDFTPDDIARLAIMAGDWAVVCTLKDYVKLAPRWPRAASPLWYVSQRVVLESGDEAVASALESLLRARSS